MARERSALVGRDADARALREMVQGDATLVLLSGDAGVGKSRLLAELLAGVGDRLVGSCLPLRNRITLLPFQEMFSAGAVRKRVARAAASLPPGLAQGLAPLLPEEMISSRGSTAPTQPEIERSFAGVRALLAAMAEAGPLVVAVEDVHWADVASLDLLTYLPGQLRDTEVTVVATLRTDDPDGRTPEMLEWLAQVQHAEGAEQLALERLDRDGTEALMATLLGGPAPAAIVDSVHRRAEGNPFFTEQLVAAMTRSDDLTSTRLPQRLADFLTSRVRTASTEGVQLLEALAVAARPLRIGALVDVAGLDEHVVRRTLRTLVETALVEVGPDQEVRTRHALLNEAVLREVPTTDRATLHRRLAQALTVEHGDALAAEIAGHWREAGEPVQELVWAEKAANAALAVGAYAEASVLLQRVLDLTDEVDGAATITEASPVELWCRAVRTVDFAGDRRRSDQMAEEAFDRFQDWPDPVELARLQHIRAHQRILNDVPGGVELLQQVVSELERLPVTTEYVEALLLLASTLVWHGDSEGALPLLERAVSLTDDSSPAFLRTRALCRLAQALDALGETARGAQALEEAAAVAQATGDPMAVVSVAVDRSDRLLTAGRLEEARAVALEGLDFAREQGQASSWTPHILVYNATEAALQQGLTETAAELVTELTDHPLRADDDILQELRAEVELRQGLVAEGQARIEGLTVVPVAVDEQADSGARVVWLSRWAGRPEPAWSAALDLAERISGTDADFQLSLHAAVAGAVADVAVAARARRDQDALATTTAAVGRLRDLSARFAGGVRHRVEKRGEQLELVAELGRAEGRADTTTWLSAAQEWTGLGRPHRAGYCWWRLGQALLDSGVERSEVRDALQRAFDAADGHVPLRNAVTELADRARIRLVRSHDNETGGPTPELPVRLTEQETKVLRLVAAGMTNAEIGTELFISPKTVSVHVSNLLRKLEVRSRVQAAAWADQVGLVRHHG